MKDLTEKTYEEILTIITEACKGFSANVDMWTKEFVEGIVENPENEYSKEELGEATGYAAGGGGFGNAVSKLCTLGLAERINGRIRLNKEINNTFITKKENGSKE